MPDENIQKLAYKNYLAMIENSIECNMFRSLFVRFKDSGVEKDVMEDGDKSCAFYLSSILELNGLIKKAHATVDSVVKDMEESDWTKTDKPKQGDIVLWDKKDENTHLGFWWSESEAISNSSAEKHPIKHSLDYEGTRKIIAVYTKDIQ
jgi:hypothetical protein